MFYLFFFLFLAVLLGTYFVCKYALNFDNDKFKSVMNRTLKISVIVYCSIVLVTILLPNAITLSYDQDILDTNPIKSGIVILNWLSCIAFIVLPISVFFKNRTIRNIAIYFCTIITLLQIGFYNQFIELYTSPNGRGLNSISVIGENFKSFLLNKTFRSFVIGIIWSLELSIPVILAVEEKHIFNVKSPREWLYSLLTLILVFLSCTPIYAPQHLFGYTDVIFDAWTLPHIIWLVLVITEIITLYFVFRNKEEDIKRIMLFILSLSLLLQYNQMFGAISLNIKRLPLQLCNIGSYLILIALMTKSKKIFDFTIIVNVVGVLFALALPDLDGEGLFYLYNMHFVLEHTNVLVVPILALLLNIFPKLDKQSLKVFFWGFLIYYLSVFVLGTIFNGIAVATDNSFWSANYLFMFDQEVAAGFVPIFGKLFNPTLKLGVFRIYPIIQIVVYLVFNLICFAVFGTILLIYFLKNKTTKK